MRLHQHPRAGWTLIETMITSVLLVGALAKATYVVHSALSLMGDESASLHYEDQARRVMESISLAVMGSDRETLLPQVEAFHSNSLRYRFSLGLEEGVVVWSEPEEIRLVQDAGRDTVEWLENPGAADERRAIWTSLVAPLLAGELVNGVDDNQNGLIDEDGLSFVLEGNRVVIRLTLRRPEVDGRLVEQTVESVVCVRN